VNVKVDNFLITGLNHVNSFLITGLNHVNSFLIAGLMIAQTLNPTSNHHVQLARKKESSHFHLKVC
jgi:hypothetical protein